MEPIDELVKVRQEKAEQLKEAGIDPYPQVRGEFEGSAAIQARFGEVPAEELEAKNEQAAAAGRIMAFRDFGKSCFVHIQDRDGRIQLYVRKDVLKSPDYAVFKKFDTGDLIAASGKVFKTKTGEVTILADEVKLLTKCLRPLPEKWHGLKDVEERYRHRYVDLIVNQKVKDVFLRRARIIEYIRAFFNQRRFIEVETPMMQLIPGGATAKPFVTHHNALGLDLYLRIAPELYLKRLIVGGFERVFEINRNFRNEGISVRHNPEFTMLEFYWAYATYEDLMDLTEEMVSSLVIELFGTTKVMYNEREIDFARPWKRLTMEDAVQSLGGIEPAVTEDLGRMRAYAKSLGVEGMENAPRGKVLAELFEQTCEDKLVQPTFITGYP
ncbi:MAG TPA: lysine--tRNA ligase, partial [Candidatus Methylomirabilis sp.]